MVGLREAQHDRLCHGDLGGGCQRLSLPLGVLLTQVGENTDFQTLLSFAGVQKNWLVSQITPSPLALNSRQ